MRKRAGTHATRHDGEWDSALEGEIDDPFRGVVAVQPDDGGTVAQRGANRVGIRRSGTARLVPAVTRGDGITGIVNIPITGRVGGGVNIPITGKTLNIPVTGDARR